MFPCPKCRSGGLIVDLRQRENYQEEYWHCFECGYTEHMQTKLEDGTIRRYRTYREIKEVSE